MIKYSTLHFNAADIRTNVAQIKRMYSNNVSMRMQNYYVLLKWSAFIVGLSKIICVMVSAVGILMVSRPVVAFLFTSSREIMIPVWVPGVDETTARGYFILTVYHAFVLALAIAGTIGADTVIIMLVVYLWPMSEIFRNMLEVINESVHNSSIRNSLQLKQFIRNLMLMHKEICNYNSRVSKIYFYQCTIEVNSNGFSLCACVFCILTVSIHILSFSL